MLRARISLVIAATMLYAASAHAIPVALDLPIRVDFRFNNAGSFNLPVVLLDHTIEFGPHAGPEALNIGEAYQVSTYDSRGRLLGTSSYFNEMFGSIIGCACTGGLLDAPLTTRRGHLIISSLSGSFNVTDVFLVGYDSTGRTSADGRITRIKRSVPEPGTLGLLITSFLSFAFARRRSKLHVSTVHD
jgi:hypothetical protein